MLGFVMDVSVEQMGWHVGSDAMTKDIQNHVT